MTALRKISSDFTVNPFAQALLAWYQKSGRTLPWRTTPTSVYKTVISEFMLQQTTVQTVIPYFENFIRRWPTFKALAGASLEDVLSAWQGLGYYTRARNLHKLAGALTLQQNGQLSPNIKELEKLPGIGPYTAAAIRSIGFNESALPLDGNLARIFARVFCVAGPKDDVLKKLRGFQNSLLPERNFSDYAQALMDLGATICTPQSPSCHMCPVSKFCQSFQSNSQNLFPEKAIKKPLARRYGHFFWVYNPSANTFLLQPESDRLLHKMLRPPRSTFSDQQEPPHFPPLGIDGSWQHRGTVQHTFTHFKLRIDVWFGATAQKSHSSPGDLWISPEKFGNHPLSTLTKKTFRALNLTQGQLFS